MKTADFCYLYLQGEQNKRMPTYFFIIFHFLLLKPLRNLQNAGYTLGHAFFINPPRKWSIKLDYIRSNMAVDMYITIMMHEIVLRKLIIAAKFVKTKRCVF